MRIIYTFSCSEETVGLRKRSVMDTCTKIFRFCRSKCHKLFKKKRNPRKTRWTKASRMARGKELRNDSTFNVEMRRNEPLKYERQLWREAVDTAKEVIALREKRYGEHIKKTLQPGKVVKRIADLQKARKKMYLISAPLQSKKQANSTGEVEQKMEEEMETN
ncbi:unnamed protein product [Acanthocheilonema viteae]|uniref:Probable ribosome biogenesis protein RLP24 n=1 Tax=Acanthocheilonema viteae TaxID=6277 RepID=A0A498ST26_ACAVI|nr:unnamed protein product [Acanthocheilonema viteae]